MGQADWRDGRAMGFGVKESRIWRKIRDQLSNGDVRLARNEVGSGVLIRHRSQSIRQKIIAECHAVALRHGGSAARVAFGLGKGTGDLIGMKRVRITQDMVGQEVAVFLSIECKTSTGATRPEQKAWQQFVNSFGGIAGIARSVEDAKEVIDNGFHTNDSGQPGEDQ